MMSDCLQLITGTNVAKGVVYNVAKFIYLADALDDIDEDYKAKRYNVFLANLPYEGRERFIKDNYERLSFILRQRLTGRYKVWAKSNLLGATIYCAT